MNANLLALFTRISEYIFIRGLDMQLNMFISQNKNTATDNSLDFIHTRRNHTADYKYNIFVGECTSFLSRFTRKDSLIYMDTAARLILLGLALSYEG